MNIQYLKHPTPSETAVLVAMGLVVLGKLVERDDGSCSFFYLTGDEALRNQLWRRDFDTKAGFEDWLKAQSLR